MNRIRIILAVLVCKLSRALIRLLGRGGTAFPGRMALKICPDVLSALSNGVRTILITGTNGKTTSARMIEQAFIDQKRSYLSNKSGANLISGITAEFAMNSSITGHCKKEYAVIECDEAASKTVLKYLKQEVIVATNVFRDQLLRQCVLIDRKEFALFVAKFFDCRVRERSEKVERLVVFGPRRRDDHRIARFVVQHELGDQRLAVREIGEVHHQVAHAVSGFEGHGGTLVGELRHAE